MPAAYAHYQFGCDCLETLPEEIRNVCLKHREVFNFGVHGPDIFFYFHPLKSNPITKFGQEMHHHSGGEFFCHCSGVYREAVKGEEKDAMTAYLLGFLAHFALDSSCHGYIDRLPKTVGISHNYAESQYEEFCMKKDGKTPVRVNRQMLLRPSEGAAKTIASFFRTSEYSKNSGSSETSGYSGYIKGSENAGHSGKNNSEYTGYSSGGIFGKDFSGITEEEVLASIEGQRSTMGLFYSPLGVKRTVLQWLIKQLRIGGGFGDLFIDGKDDPRCEETNQVIAGMQEQALKRYPELAENLLRFFDGDEDLDEYFQYDFEGEIQNERASKA